MRVKWWAVRMRMAGALLVGLSVAGGAQALPRCDGKLPMVEINRRQEATLLMLRERQYAALQQRMDGHLAAYMDGRISDDELFYEFGAFDRWGPFLTPAIQEWVNRYPSSYAAHHAMALHLASVAWQERGQQWGRDTPGHQMQQFRDRLELSRGWSLKALRLHPKPVLSYQQLVTAAKALPQDAGPGALVRELLAGLKLPSWSGTPMHASHWLTESLRIQPDNVIVRIAYVWGLAPKWGGSVPELLRFADPSSHPGLSADRLAAVSYAATLEIASDHWMQRRRDEAVDAYRLAARMCRLNEPWINIAYIRLEQTRFADALEAANHAIEIYPDSVNGGVLKARALKGLGRHPEAVVLLERLAALNSPEACFLLAEYHLNGTGGAARNPELARRLLDTAARGGEARAIRLLESISVGQPSRGAPPG